MNIPAPTTGTTTAPDMVSVPRWALKELCDEHDCFAEPQRGVCYPDPGSTCKTCQALYYGLRALGERV